MFDNRTQRLSPFFVVGRSYLCRSLGWLVASPLRPAERPLAGPLANGCKRPSQVTSTRSPSDHP